MDDATLSKLRSLIAQRDKIDEELDDLVKGRAPKTLVCSFCQQPGHTARTCPSKTEGGA